MSLTAVFFSCFASSTEDCALRFVLERSGAVIPCCHFCCLPTCEMMSMLHTYECLCRCLCLCLVYASWPFLGTRRTVGDEAGLKSSSLTANKSRFLFPCPKIVDRRPVFPVERRMASVFLFFLLASSNKATTTSRAQVLVD